LADAKKTVMKKKEGQIFIDIVRCMTTKSDL